MHSKSHKLLGAAVLLLLLAVGICTLLTRKAAVPKRPFAPASAPVVQQDRSTNFKLTDDFIRWFELQYIKGMRQVDGSTTDCDDLIKEVGQEQTLERYADLRRVNLDYLREHPDCRTLPDADLEKIALAQYEHVVKNVRASGKWLDYLKDKLRLGVIESYKIAARAWIPLYQKLLNAPPPAPNTDLTTFIRTSLTKEEYLHAMDGEVQSTTVFHAALKEGLSWYAPWAPWVKGMIEKSCRQNIAVIRATTEQIYGK
jgi:hypothetical protein